MRTTIAEFAAEAGLGLTGGLLLLLVATPRGQQWLKAGAKGAARGLCVTGGAIATMCADLKQGWADLIQEVKEIQSAGESTAP